MIARKPCPSDVSDEGWALVAPYLALLPEGAGQRRHSSRELFNGLRCVARHGIPWRAVPNDLPPWAAVHQQSTRWLRAGRFKAIVQDMRALLRVGTPSRPPGGRVPQRPRNTGRRTPVE